MQNVFYKSPFYLQLSKCYFSSFRNPVVRTLLMYSTFFFVVSTLQSHYILSSGNILKTNTKMIDSAQSHLLKEAEDTLKQGYNVSNLSMHSKFVLQIQFSHIDLILFISFAWKICCKKLFSFLQCFYFIIITTE